MATPTTTRLEASEDAVIPAPAAPSRTVLWMIAGGLICAVAAGALLWWREGDRLFTDGLVSALMRCF